jgi:hypothetical protein
MQTTYLTGGSSAAAPIVLQQLAGCGAQLWAAGGQGLCTRRLSVLLLDLRTRTLVTAADQAAFAAVNNMHSS